MKPARSIKKNIAQKAMSLAYLAALFASLPGCLSNESKGSKSSSYPSVNFSATASTKNEGGVSTQVYFTLSSALSYSVSANYTITGGTAVNGTDYSASSSGTVSFSPGSTTAAITVTLSDDAVVESDKTITFAITGVSSNAQIGTIKTHTLTITDDDATTTVDFTSAAQTVTETAGSTTVTASIPSARSYDITIPLTFSGTALVSSDYTASSSSITISAGSTSGSITISLLNDSVADGTKTLTIDMTDPGNADLGTTIQHTITITDAGGAALPDANFSAATQTFTEAGGTVTATLTLSTASTVDVYVPFTVTGTAVDGSDYSLNTSSPILFSAGQTSKTVSITITDDALTESDETIILTMGTPTNANIGATDTQTITITDNEAAAFSVTSVYPPSGPSQGENKVTIYGTGFVNGDTSITINSVACTSLTFVSTGELTCIAGSSAAGTVDVVATNTITPATTTLVNGYTYLDWATTQTTSQPVARNYHTAIWTGSEMIVWGGFDGTSYYGNGGRYNPATDSWTAIAAGLSNEPAARQNHSAVWTGTEMIVWGGDNGTSYFSDGGRYTPITNTWTTMSSTNAPSARSFHSATWSGNGEMVIWGGTNGTVLNTGARYSPTANTWTATPTSTGVPAARYGHTATMSVINGLYRLIIWGGTNGSSDLASGGMLNLSLGTPTWQATSTTSSPSARSNHSAIWTGSKMIVWGGRSGSSYLNSGYTFTPPSTHTAGTTGGGTWASITSASAPTARMAHTAVWNGQEMLIWGGYDGSSYLATGGRYKLSNDTWSSISTTNAPSARSLHKSVFTGDKMIVWGGNNGASIGTGAVYTIPNANSNTWSSTTTTSAPSARNYSSAVWTGSEMIIWGGDTSIATGSCVNSGARYNPTTNSWSATQTTSAPTARCEHTAVWTGKDMIIWGGRSTGTTAVNTGSRYSPAYNTWTATTTTSAAAARYKHTAVWTGSDMIIWGGVSSGGSTTLNTGSKYNPNGNSWTAMTTTSAPSARIRHTAIWTGSNMVVWGGSSGSTYYQSGGLYDPSANSWTATSTGGSVPSARESHSAVWTGTQMIVWGGFNGTTRVNTGALFTASTNTWSAATSTTNAPTARSEHTAVWSGSRMLVWGGYSTSYTNTGAAYNPVSDTWSTFTVNNAPAGRIRHTAIWTDSAMIIWGGSNSAQTFNSGSVFTP